MLCYPVDNISCYIFASGDTSNKLLEISNVFLWSYMRNVLSLSKQKNDDKKMLKFERMCVYLILKILMIRRIWWVMLGIINILFSKSLICFKSLCFISRHFFANCKIINYRKNASSFCLKDTFFVLKLYHVFGCFLLCFSSVDCMITVPNIILLIFQPP